MLMLTHNTSTVLSTKYTIDILRILRCRGETIQKDVKHIISTNNKTMSEKLGLLQEWGLVTCEYRAGKDTRHVSKYWKLTETGEKTARLLDEIEVVLGGSLEEE